MRINKLCLLISLCLFAFSAKAEYQLDNEASSLNFISIKKDKIAEVHFFKQMSGSIDAEGVAKISIDLTSVETNIAIRNERMNTLLFETVNFSAASVSAELDVAVLQSMEMGSSIVLPVELRLDLHGSSKVISAQLRVTGLEGGALLVSTQTPILLNAFDFGLNAGVEKLMEVAKLPSISTAVPVTFNLMFKH